MVRNTVHDQNLAFPCYVVNAAVDFEQIATAANCPNSDSKPAYPVLNQTSAAVRMSRCWIRFVKRHVLLLEIHFNPHPHMKVDGRDIHLELPLAPWEAALGAVISIHMPNGEIQYESDHACS